MGLRGEYTTEIAGKMEAFLGRPSSVRELRLLPYIQHVMVNDQRIEPQRINSEERAILSQWREAGHIEGGASGMAITRDFWVFINDVLFDSYVACEDG